MLRLGPTEHRGQGSIRGNHSALAVHHQHRRFELVEVPTEIETQPLGLESLPTALADPMGHGVALKGFDLREDLAAVGIAVARKLAVLLHRLRETGEVYDPLLIARGDADGPSARCAPLRELPGVLHQAAPAQEPGHSIADCQHKALDERKNEVKRRHEFRATHPPVAPPILLSPFLGRSLPSRLGFGWDRRHGQDSSLAPCWPRR